MTVRNINDVEHQPVGLAGADRVAMALMVGREHGAPHFALRHFNVERDGHTPHHQHDYEHEVFIVSGTGTLHLDGSDHPLKAGDVAYVPADTDHQFRANSGTGLSFLCLVPVERNCGGDTPGS